MPTTGPGRRRVPIVPLAILLGAAIVAPAAAHTPADGVQADHAYAFDPLFPLTTGNNLFPGHAPDEITAMASTTKAMTLLVAVDALKANVVELQDDVVVSFNAFAQPPTSSMMTDDDGALLAAGEHMSFEDLLFGMMIPSGNNASYAVAEHVAEGYLGTFGTVASFVSMMNSKAVALGMTKTIYSNPAGYATGIHQTTAMDLARLWKAGMAEPEFARIVRPQEWVATGVAGATTKTYTMEKAGNYPGMDGHKNGRNTPCSADQDECFAASAVRIGRRLIVTGMQADGWVGSATGDAAEMLDAGFNRVFHPDARGASPLGAAASKQALVCPTLNRAVTASIPSVGRTRLTSWNANIQSQTWSIAGATNAPTGALATTTASQAREVDAIALSATRVVTATIVGTSVELRLWNVPTTGAPTTIGSAIGTRTAGVAQSIELVRLGSTLFASVARSSDNRMVIKTWRSSSTGLAMLGNLSTTVTNVSSMDVASATGQSAPRFVTVIRSSVIGASSSAQSWEVNSTSGAITLRDTEPFIVSLIPRSIVPAPVIKLPGETTVDKFYAVAGMLGDGSLGLIYVRIRSNGSIAPFAPGVGLAGTISDVELAPFGASGILAISRLTTGVQRQDVWESFRTLDPDLFPNRDAIALRISNHQTSTSGVEPEVCAANPNNRAEGDFVSGLREGLGSIVRLRGWRIGDRP